tara:strand:+ start:14637 stop:14969 length:333 start_codon:yes stop_codon:yes gene_type:complete
MAILFLVAAVLQGNDPDPGFWISIYLIPAILSAAEAWRWLKNRSMLILRSIIWPLLSIVCLLYGFSLFQGLEAEWYNDEVTRESGGLFLIAIHSVISYWSVRNQAGITGN